MSDKHKIPEKVKYIYFRDSEYKYHNIHGVYGGMTMQGEIFFELFTEVPERAEEMINKINADGSIGKELDRAPKRNLESIVVERKSHFGAFISPETAELIANWLLSKVEESKNKKQVIEGKK